MSFRIAVTVVAAGVAASMALGEFIPFLTSVGAEFGLSLTGAGWLSSAITVVAGLACLPLGMRLDQYRLRGVFVAALAVLGVSGLGAAVSGGGAALFSWRVVQAAGYALVVVIGPSLLARLLEGRSRETALALWGLGVPGGLALAGMAGAFAGPGGWRAAVAGVGGGHVGGGGAGRHRAAGCPSRGADRRTRRTGYEMAGGRAGGRIRPGRPGRGHRGHRAAGLSGGRARHCPRWPMIVWPGESGR
ncbi:MFS transporter [Nonomuraea sp. NPDC049480]|uniref:MFS transporter n=1 Tax=Nonomuraea sp. NPDC049480 TaxID=3364353 RepID=UPI00378E647D